MSGTATEAVDVPGSRSRRAAAAVRGTRAGTGRSTATTPGAVLLAALLLGACAGGGGLAPDDGAGAGRSASGRVQQCKAGDTRVASEAQCLQDDAACYALASGGYCTGERGNTCPAGSDALPAGGACPPGARCFSLGESLTCAIALD